MDQLAIILKLLGKIEAKLESIEDRLITMEAKLEAIETNNVFEVA